MVLCVRRAHLTASSALLVIRPNGSSYDGEQCKCLALYDAPFIFGLRNYIMRGEDSIIPPDKTMELEWLKGLLYESDDIREGMVNDLRTQILGKVYEVDAEQVAGKIIQHGLCIFIEPQGNSFHPP